MFSPAANRGFASVRGWRSLRPNSATPQFSSPPSLSPRSHSVYALWVKFEGAFTAIYGPEPPPSRVEYNIEKITTSFKMDKYYKVENMNSEPMYFSTEAQADKSVIGPYGTKRSLLVIE